VPVGVDEGLKAAIPKIETQIDERLLFTAREVIEPRIQLEASFAGLLDVRIEEPIRHFIGDKAVFLQIFRDIFRQGIRVVIVPYSDCPMADGATVRLQNPAFVQYELFLECQCLPLAV